MKNKLIWKLFAINIPVIGVVILVVWVAVDFLAADYFTVLMERYKISPADTHQMFVDAVHRYLIHASLVAAAIAALLSFLLTRTVLRPLSDMTEVTQRIAEGDYSARVTVGSDDEVGKLGGSFNRMADSLETVEQLRRGMVVDFAHELRTPLTSVRGYLEALADGVVQPTRETFTILQDEILRLVRLVEDLHQLTKADAARAYLSRESVNLSDLVHQVLELHRFQFQSRDIDVKTEFSEEGATVLADRDKLLQVLRNLVQNAGQYTPEGGTLRVIAERDGDNAKVTFANTCAGVTESDMASIFERFYRVEKSRSRDSGGAGIGLSIVKELVDAHGGRVGAKLIGDEIQFWFSVPA
ncbi:MAG: HAMP domain-containing protein [Alphaproteobacteria bacterium]|nr:HAMP domain-containing protein [Alphaproteobacteria bacterium]